MINSLTIDVEDYFHVSAFEKQIKPQDWGDYPLRVEGNTRRVLDLLDEHETTATFFVLGWVADRVPGLVQEIDRRGHEIASHGYWHQRVNTQERAHFRSDIRRSKALLEDLVGRPVLGYRAPSYSIDPASLWAYDELADAGFRYDSSVFPIRHDFYGISDWPRFPFRLSRRGDGDWYPDPGMGGRAAFFELPITTLLLAGGKIPIAGGGYFRLYPYNFTRWGLRRINHIEGRPFMFYLHPWEFDPGQPRTAGASWKSKVRHYLNLEKTAKRFGRLLEDFRFSSIRETFGMDTVADTTNLEAASRGMAEAAG